MRFNTHSPAIRSSVASVFAVAVISLIAWSFETYSDHVWETRSPTAALQATSHDVADARDA